MSFWPFKLCVRRPAPRSAILPSCPQLLEVPVTSNVPELPPEIWVLILVHIDIGPDLQNMRGLNRALRTLALEREYREVDFSREQDKHILKHIQLFWWSLLPLISHKLQILWLDWSQCVATNLNAHAAVKWKTGIFHRIELPDLQSLTIVVSPAFRTFDNNFQSFV
ncbi:hypothetical protein H0H93_010094, partial [Arthromyces matolae]